MNENIIYTSHLTGGNLIRIWKHFSFVKSKQTKNSNEKKSYLFIYNFVASDITLCSHDSVWFLGETEKEKIHRLLDGRQKSGKRSTTSGEKFRSYLQEIDFFFRKRQEKGEAITRTLPGGKNRDSVEWRVFICKRVGKMPFASIAAQCFFSIVQKFG